jgi:hypothetical protein
METCGNRPRPEHALRRALHGWIELQQWLLMYEPCPWMDRAATVVAHV